MWTPPSPRLTDSHRRILGLLPGPKLTPPHSITHRHHDAAQLKHNAAPVRHECNDADPDGRWRQQSRRTMVRSSRPSSFLGSIYGRRVGTDQMGGRQYLDQIRRTPGPFTDPDLITEETLAQFEKFKILYVCCLRQGASL